MMTIKTNELSSGLLSTVDTGISVDCRLSTNLVPHVNRALSPSHGECLARVAHVFLELVVGSARRRRLGFISKWEISDVARGHDMSPKELRELLSTTVNGSAPLLHKRGARCECLSGLVWAKGTDYAVHDRDTYFSARYVPSTVTPAKAEDETAVVA